MFLELDSFLTLLKIVTVLFPYSSCDNYYGNMYRDTDTRTAETVMTSGSDFLTVRHKNEDTK